MEDEKLRIIVAHPGKQHSFKLAAAINKIKRYDLIYITSVYDKENSMMMRILKKVSSSRNKKRANERKCIELDDNQVVQFCALRGLLRIFLAHYDKSEKLLHWFSCRMADAFGEKVAKYAIKHQADMVISYDTFSFKCFSYLQKNAPNIIRVMDASAANLVFQKDIFQKDILLSPAFSKKLMNEFSYTMKKKRQQYSERENNLTQYVIAASVFTKKSFNFSGIKNENIFICPYGVDIEGFSYVRKAFDAQRKLVFVFVGGTKQAKGLSYLLDAFMKIPENEADLSIIGLNNLPGKIQKHYEKRVSFLGLKLHSELPQLLQRADVVFFPSLSDGFGFAAIEGMACGCPVVCSKNAGIADLIIDGYNGFVVPAQNEFAIYEKMLWFIEHKDSISILGKNASLTASQYSWEKYEKTVQDTLQGLFHRTCEGKSNCEQTCKELYL